MLRKWVVLLAATITVVSGAYSTPVLLHVYPEVTDQVGDPDVYVQGQVCPEYMRWGIQLPIHYILHSWQKVSDATYVPQRMPLKVGVLSACPVQRGT